MGYVNQSTCHWRKFLSFISDKGAFCAIGNRGGIIFQEYKIQ